LNLTYRRQHRVTETRATCTPIDSHLIRIGSHSESRFYYIDIYIIVIVFGARFEIIVTDSKHVISMYDLKIFNFKLLLRKKCLSF